MGAAIAVLKFMQKSEINTVMRVIFLVVKPLDSLDISIGLTTYQQPLNLYEAPVELRTSDALPSQ